MALAATITVDPHRGLTSISPLIYGQFLEHFHRQVFGGAFESLERADCSSCQGAW
jgi:alpha-L-arabinofuranosidase